MPYPLIDNDHLAPEVRADEDAATLPPDGEACHSRAAFLGYIRTTLGSLLTAVEFFRKGIRLKIDSFVLRGLTNYGRPVSVTIPAPDGDLVEQHLASLLQVTVPEAIPTAPASLLRPSGLEIFNRLEPPRSKENVAPLSSATWESTGLGLASRGNWSLPKEWSEDYVFSYPIPSAEPPASRVEYCGALLTILLETVDLLCDGKPVFPDCLHSNGETLTFAPRPLSIPYEMGPRADVRDGRQPLHSVAATEPAIVVLARHWALLAGILKVRIADQSSWMLDGFRLRRTADWVVPGSGHPAEIYEYLARVCNVSCKFCYLYGNPSSLAVARGATVISEAELETRLRYFDSKQRRTLFHAQWEINEFLVDPKLHTLLPELRRRTKEPFYFITNGSPLKSNVVSLLAQVQPVHLIVSINSIDEERRADIMQETSSLTATAISSLRLLVEHEIPFGISVVAFPHFPLDDLEKTICAADSLPAAFVRVNLPGFTRELPYEHDFDTDEYWATVVEWVHGLRSRVRIPILTIPSAFEQNVLRGNPLEARVLGTIPRSPAADAGLCPDDVVTAVNGFNLRSRAELNSLLLLARGRVSLTVRSALGVRKCELDADAPPRFPYTGHVNCKYIFPCGIVAAPSLSPRNADEIREIAGSLEARQAWIITSKLMAPAARALIDQYAPELGDRIRFVPVENEYLGGNIRIMDMCTVGDIALAIERDRQSVPLPDVILLSASGFNEHGRDLQGRHWGDLERHFGVPVRLMSASRFAF